MASTKYLITVDGVEVSSHSVKQTALAKWVDALRAANVGQTVKIATAAGTLIRSQVRGQRVVVKIGKPYTRVEDAPDATLQALAGGVPEGFVLAYRRPRNRTSVMRDPQAIKGAPYGVVVDEVDGKVYPAATTRAAGAIMVALGAAR